MGNTNSSKDKNKPTLQTQLKTIRASHDQTHEERFIQTSNCCWFQVNTLKKRKIIWENNFIFNCTQVKYQFEWAGQMVDLVKNNIKPKGSFFKQIHDLKSLITTSTEGERQILITPSEVEQFKSNLKRSVLLSSNRNNKYYDSSHNKLAASTVGNTTMRASKLQFNRFSNASWRSSFSGTPSKKKERNPSFSSSNKSGLRKSIMSFVDDTLTSVFGAQRQISKQMSNNLEVFLKFSMILETHFNNPDCMFYHIKKKFIEFVCQNYNNEVTTAERMPHFVDSINQFMVILKEAVFDYYNLTSFGQGQMFENPFISNDENILSLCRTIFFKEKKFYDVIFSSINKYNEQREKQLQNILTFLSGSQPELFYVKDKFCLNRRTLDTADKEHYHPSNIEEQITQDTQAYRQCKLMLNELQKSRTPVSKMKIILACSQMMNKQIQKFYDMNALQRQKWILDADQVLSIFCYLIVGTKINNLLSHLFIMDNFSTSSQMISIFGYYLSVMNCAVEQLESQYAQKLVEKEQMSL